MNTQSPELYDTSGLIKTSRRQHSSAGDVRQFSLFSGLRLHQLTKLKPAYLALIVEITAALLALPILNLMRISTYSTFAFVLLQATLSVMLAIVVNLDRWWRFILFFFPIAAWVLHGLQLPSWIYLVGFLFSLSLFWTTFRTQVPFYPSRLKVWLQVETLMPKNKSIRMIDIGSGLGDLSMYLANKRPDSRFQGIEIAPLPWLISIVRAFVKKSGVRFSFGDYNTLNFAEYDIIFAYLSPAAMPGLWQKAQAEMVKGSQLVSYEFVIPNVTPSKVLQINASTPPIYVWQF